MMFFSYVPDYIPPPPSARAPLRTNDMRDGIGRHLTRADARTARVMHDGIDLYVALACIRSACGQPSMLLVLEAMRTSRRERAAVLRDARRHPYWALLRRRGAAPLSPDNPPHR